MNQVSGACTFTISRPRARASSTLRAASTSRISGTSGESSRSDAGDRARLGTLREARVLGEEAAGVAGLGQLPVRLALRQLRRVDQQIDRVRVGIDNDLVALGDKCD